MAKKRSIIKILVFIPFLLLCLDSNVKGQGEAWEEIFFKAGQAYKEGRYKDAIENFNELIRLGHGGGHIFYNLGNAFFRENQLGKAILNYKRALLFLPRDPDLKFNLSYSLDQARDALPDSRNMIEQTFFWINDLTFKELLWIFALLNILFWGILLIRLFVRPEWSYYIMIISIIFWLIGGFSFGLKWHQLASDDRAVILGKEVKVMAGPDTRDTVLFKLHEGAVVSYEREEDGWALISLPDKKRGWLKAYELERIMGIKVGSA